MNFLGRLVLIFSIAVTGSLAVAAAATAAGSASGGGGGGAVTDSLASAWATTAGSGGVGGKGGKGGPLGPGDYTFTDTAASATFGAPTAKGGPPQFFIQVDRNVSTFQPDPGPNRADRSLNGVTKGTTVTLQVSTPTLSGFGCFSILPSDFTVSKDLQKAALHTTLSTPCTGGKGGGGLPASIRLDVTWTGSDVVGTTRNTNHFECAGYTFDSNFAAQNAGVMASGSVSLKSVSLWAQSPADAATLISSEVHTHISGVEPAVCAALQLSA